MKSLNKVFAFSLMGVPACIAVAYAFRHSVSDSIKGGKLYEDALDMLRHHKGAVYLLGQPISDSMAKFNNSGLNAEGRRDVRVNVSGPKSDGILFISTVPDKEDKLQIDTIQLQIGKDCTRRLVIKKSLNETENTL